MIQFMCCQQLQAVGTTDWPVTTVHVVAVVGEECDRRHEVGFGREVADFAVRTEILNVEVDRCLKKVPTRSRHIFLY